MSKTAKVSAIFFISTIWLILMRILFSFLPLSDNVSGWLFSFLVQCIGMGAIPLLLYKFWVKDSIVEGLRLKTKIPPLTYLFAVILGFLVSYLNTGISVIWQTLIRLLGYTHVNSAGTIYSDAGVFVMELITTALLPCVFEELTDRGIVLRMFDGVENKKAVVIVTALLFALGHQNVVQTGYTFFGGLVFAYLALSTGSIIPGMIIHFMNNAFSVISGYSSQHNGIYAAAEEVVYGFINEHFFMAILTWIATGFAIYWILKFVTKLQPKDDLPKEDGEAYFFPNKIQYVDEIFGIGLKKEGVKRIQTKAYWYEYAFLYGSIALTFFTTLFTFMWGVWR